MPPFQNGLPMATFINGLAGDDSHPATKLTFRHKTFLSLADAMPDRETEALTKEQRQNRDKKRKRENKRKERARKAKSKTGKQTRKKFTSH
jgi:hypothetical protein